MKRIRFNFPLRMWSDVGIVSVPLFAIGLGGKEAWALWLSGIIVVAATVGFVTSLLIRINDRPLEDSPICRDVGMAATYVWPCILTGLILDNYGIESCPFYIFAVFVMGIILFVNHNDLM